MDINILIALLIIIIVILLVYNKYEEFSNEVQYVKSNIDNKDYLVRNMDDKQDAADMMAKIRIKLENLTNSLIKENPNDESYLRLYEKFDPEQITEAGKNNKYTSYSINKGEKIVLCIRQKNDKENIVDENTLTFVALHELAHIMTKSVGHTDEFWDNFRKILKEAINKNIYTKVDYSNNPQEYCGIQVSDTPI